MRPHKNKKEIICLSADEIKSEWERSKALDIRSRLKIYKKLVAAIGHNTESLTQASAELYFEILKISAEVPDHWGSIAKVMANFIPQYLSATGRENFKIISTNLKKLFQKYCFK